MCEQLIQYEVMSSSISVLVLKLQDAEKHLKIDYIHNQHNAVPSQEFGTTPFAMGKNACRPLHTATTSPSVLRNFPV